MTLGRFGRSDRRALRKSEGGSYYLIGDGPPVDWRTHRSGFPERPSAAGFCEWNDLAQLHEVRDLPAVVLGADWVLVGCEGFNAVRVRRPIPARPGDDATRQTSQPEEDPTPFQEPHGQVL